MNDSKIAVRYAKALFEAALDKGRLDSIQEDMNSLGSLDRQVPEFRDLLESPILNVRAKQKILTNLFKGKLEDLSFRFLMLLTEKKRESFLPSACRVFHDLYKKEKDIMAAMVTTAGTLQVATAKHIKETLEDFFKSHIELITEVNPDLIGGFILRVEDQQLDASVALQLKKIKKELDQSVIF